MAKNINNKRSLFYILGFAFFISVTLTVMINTTYYYINTKNQLTNQILENIEVSSLQLKKSVIPYIESYQVAEYEDLIKNEISHKNLYAIIVEDFVTGKVMGDQSYTTGIIRDENYKTVEYDDLIHKQNLENNPYFKETILENSNKEKIGKLTIYGTTYFVDKKLNDIIFTNVIVSLIIYIFISYILYLIIRKNLVMPIENIVNSLKYTNNSKILDKKIDEHTTKEFSFLSDSINKMVKEIKISQREIEDNQLRWEFAVEGNGDGLWDWNIQTNEVYFSKQWKKMLGYEDEDIKNNLDEWKSRVHEDDITNTMDDIVDYLDGKTEQYVNEHRMRCKDGSYKWILDRGIIVERDNENNPLRIIGTHTDITSRKIYEEELTLAMTVFQNTHDGIIITDSNNKIINLNPAFTQTTGYKLSEIKGFNPSILKSFQHEDDFYENMWDKINSVGFWSGEIVNKRKNGKYYEEYLTINAIKNGDKIEKYIGIFSDISIQKQQEKMLLQQARTSAVGEMIGNIAHQWRQPLSIISTAATGLQLNMEIREVSNKEIVDILKRINDSTQHLSSTIEDFRNFFRGDISDISKFNLIEPIKKVDELTKDSFKNNFVEIHKDIDKNLIIEGNMNLLIQAFINIYNNALDVLKEKVPSEKRLFFISLKEEENYYVFKFLDNAGGIEKEHLEKVFDPYFTTKHESVGTGLGLYMAHQIITKQFNGRVSVHNLTYNFMGEELTGAEFVIKLSKQ